MKLILSIFGTLSTLFSIATSVPSQISKQLQEVETQQGELDYRLPTRVVPSNYDITITPYFEGEKQFTFDGVVKITIRTSQPNTNEIIVHAHDLTIRESMNTLTEAKDPTSIAITNRSRNSITHKYTLSLASSLKTNTDYILEFYYSGNMGTDMKGFYRSSYIQDGVKKWLGATHMEPTYARQVFPCFDEPHFKATFDLKIVRPKNFTVSVSNAKIANSFDMGAHEVFDEFKTTPRMSTYLLAFIVSDLRVRENAAKTFTVVARADAYTQTEYAHDIGPRILSRLEDYLDYKYSNNMEKMEMAAIPDFLFNAMENWGLLTFKESRLLYDPEATNYLDQQGIATMIGHEQAHMWFGNLVTCEWWKYLWINEGFARYLEYFGTMLLTETHWNLNMQFSVNELQTALYVDSQANVLPMTHDVASPEEILSTFNKISYNKAASVIRMLENIIGSDNFQKGVQQFIKDNQHGTSTPEKLNSAFQRYSGDSISISSFMTSWTTQSGYPVVMVERKTDGRNLLISQRRFILKDRSHNDTSKWQLHLNYVLSTINNFDRTQALFVMTKDQESIQLELQDEVDWAIFNVQQTGYYRVNYDDTTWQNIADTLKTNLSRIHVLNRAQIIDDSLNLVRGNYIDYNLALSILQYIENEPEYQPWKAAFNNLEYISNRLNSTQSGKYKKYILHLIDAIYNRLGFTIKGSDSRLDVYLRTLITGHACKYGHEQCRNAAKLEFEHMETSSTHKVPVNSRPTVYCTGIAEGSTDEWEYLWHRYLIDNVSTEKLVILKALGCTSNKNILEKYLEFMSTDLIRLQDKLVAFDSVLSGDEEKVQIVLDYVIANNQKMIDSFGGYSELAKILSSLSARFSTQQQITQLDNFYKNSNIAELDVAAAGVIRSAIDDAKYDLNWCQQHLPAVFDYIQDITGSATMLSISLSLIVIGVMTTFW